MIKNIATMESLVGGTRNFRDLGGYTTSNDTLIKPGLLFRSDHLGNLTKQDWQRFNSLKIKNIIDLRSAQERRYKPNKLPNPYLINTHRIEFAMLQTNINQFKSRVLAGRLGDVDYHRQLMRVYGEFVSLHQEQMSQIFSLLTKAENYPLLIHCNSGKDRVGFVSAMILAALQVEQQTILFDYMLSNDFMRRFTRNTLIYLRLFSLFRVETDKLRPLLESRPEYLQESFNQIQIEFGHLDNYFSTLGVDSAVKTRLESILCQ